LDVGDQWHYLFTNVDTNEETEYDVSNLDDTYPLSVEDNTINPDFKDRLFKAVINVVPGKVYQGLEYFEIQNKLIIVDLKLLENQNQ
jgi:hypothetical protein